MGRNINDVIAALTKARRDRIETHAARLATDMIEYADSLGEIRKGIERLRPKDPLQAEVLERWLDTLKHDFAQDVLPVTDEVADCWGRLTARTPLAVTDSLIAATALTHGLAVVTRNVADFIPCGVPVVNPFG